MKKTILTATFLASLFGVVTVNAEDQNSTDASWEDTWDEEVIEEASAADNTVTTQEITSNKEETASKNKTASKDATVSTKSPAKKGFKVGLAFDQGFGVAVQYNEKINAFLGYEGISADYVLATGKFSNDLPLNWYISGGAYFNWDKDNVFGGQIPFGVSYTFLEQWDVYGYVAPGIEAELKHNNNLRGNLNAALGIRYGF